ncbi:MAG: glycosyltransferase family A protein [Nevskia sp.]|nr:glycosyltransferase family A protein [Nevskia sp.]
MKISVIVRSKDEAPRLRLVLTSLACQTVPAEVIVVNDGSSDHTEAVLAEASSWLPLRSVHHASARGRSAASNAGAAHATGDVLLFMDGDVLAHPDVVARHGAAHSRSGSLIGRGETFHLRGTRFFSDPETGAPWPGDEARVARLPEDERRRTLVTRELLLNNFAEIDRRAVPGIYPGAGPRRLYELEMDALRHHPECGVLWAASSGSNMSVSRDRFMRAGGFKEHLDNNEHRELALRLCASGARMAPIGGARTYHLTHRVGWRDPLAETGWDTQFYRDHPIQAVKLLAVFWASLADRSVIPPQARINSLPELEAAARDTNGVDYDAVRRLIPGFAATPL